MKAIISINIILLFTGCATSSDFEPEMEECLTTQAQDSLAMLACDSLYTAAQEAPRGASHVLKVVPTDLDDAFAKLDSAANPELLEWIRCLPDGEYANIMHKGFGMYLRNQWGLWGGSEFGDNLANKGIFHPDDMTSIILTSYQRRTKGEPILLEEQIEYYQDFWRNEGMPVDSLLNELKRKN